MFACFLTNDLIALYIAFELIFFLINMFRQTSLSPLKSEDEAIKYACTEYLRAVYTSSSHAYIVWSEYMETYVVGVNEAIPQSKYISCVAAQLTGVPA